MNCNGITAFLCLLELTYNYFQFNCINIRILQLKPLYLYHTIKENKLNLNIMTWEELVTLAANEKKEMQNFINSFDFKVERCEVVKAEYKKGVFTGKRFLVTAKDVIGDTFVRLKVNKEYFASATGVDELQATYNALKEYKEIFG